MTVNITKLSNYIEPIIRETMTAQRIPGMSIIVFDEEKVLYERGFGNRDRDNHLEYNPDTLNGFGSCTKAFTALSVMQLQEQGKLNISDPLSKYLPITLGSEEDPLTIEQALSHTTGVPNLGMATISFIGDINSKVPGIPMGTWEDVYDFVNDAKEWISHGPNEVWHYNNAMYTLVGKIVEELSGLAIGDYIVKNLLGPLGMSRSHFDRDVLHQDDNLSVPYTFKKNAEGEMRPVPGEFPFDKFIHAPGGLVSSCREMMAFIRMMMADGKVGDTQLATSESIREVTTPRMKVPITVPDLPSVMGYGLGWGVYDNFLEDRVIRHTGGITGGMSMMAYMEKRKIGIIAIGNYGMPPFGEILQGFAPLLGNDVEEVFPKPKKYAYLQDLVGKYWFYKKISSVDVSVKGNILHIKGDQGEFPLHFTDDPHTFEMHQGPAIMPVRFAKVGDIWEFTVERSKYRKIS